MIGKTIFMIRKKRGYSLSELAGRASISKSYLSNIERNINKNPSIEVIKKIAVVLEVDLLTLLEPNNKDEDIQLLEKEWLDFIYELKETGIDKSQINEFRNLIEFIKWQNENSATK